MDVRGPLLVLSIICIATTCAAWPMFKKRMFKTSDTPCQRLQRAGMAVYNDAQFLLPPEATEHFGPDRVSEILCTWAGARTLSDVTDAIDPNMNPYVRDMISLYYLFGTSLLKFLGGEDGVAMRVNFARDFAEFVRANLLDFEVSYDDAYEFTSRLVNTYGEDFLKTLARGTSVFDSPYAGPMIAEDDILDAEKLARAFAEDMKNNWDDFAETSGLSVNTVRTGSYMIEFLTSPQGNMMYPLMVQLEDDGLVLLQTAVDLGLDDLDVSQ